ncbi:MAG: flavoprotein, partial [Armatimonadota bacterium]|nr:flavoprotein [Armatimonadota bacterium]
MTPKRLVVAITGASGSVYAISALRHLVSHYHQIYVIASDNARGIMRDELGSDDIPALVGMPDNLTMLDNSDLSAPPSSGSHRYDG